MEKQEQAKLLANPVTVCTIDQLFTFVYRALGTEIFAATLKYSKLILDEIQSYEPAVIAIIIYGLKTIQEMGGRFAIITATFPPVLKHFMEENADNEIFSNELKKQAGYGKDGEKGFDGAVANLMMQMYICNCDFRKRINKRGEQYGWDVAVYSSIEHIYGYDYVTSDYKEKPEASWQKIVAHMNILYSSATEKQIKKILK